MTLMTAVQTRLIHAQFDLSRHPRTRNSLGCKRLTHTARNGRYDVVLYYSSAARPLCPTLFRHKQASYSYVFTDILLLSAICMVRLGPGFVDIS